MLAGDYILFLVVSFGVVYGIIGSSLFAPIRIMLAAQSGWLAALLYCPYCVGFWVGIGLRAFWPLASSWQHAAINLVEGGFLVVGAITLLRAAMPTFLEGAFDHERDALEARLREPGVPEDDD